MPSLLNVAECQKRIRIGDGADAPRVLHVADIDEHSVAGARNRRETDRRIRGDIVAMRGPVRRLSAPPTTTTPPAVCSQREMRARSPRRRHRRVLGMPSRRRKALKMRGDAHRSSPPRAAPTGTWMTSMRNSAVFGVFVGLRRSIPPARRDAAHPPSRNVMYTFSRSFGS